jgi:rhodanese-related sulfurtransferase
MPAMNSTLQSKEVQQRVDAGAMVIDVMTPEDYAACHVAGAQNACIYEMVFLDRIAECVPDKNTELIVYDATGATRTAELARDRLREAGYANVSLLSGGLASWREAGLPVEKGEVSATIAGALVDGTYRIDVEKSRVEWIGRSLVSRHFGRINILEGALTFVAGRLSASTIVFNMKSMTNLDLEDPDYRDLLISHLKSDDFFAVKRFPTATLIVTGWQPQGEASPQAPNGIMTGELTIKDITRTISFPAIVAPQEDGSITAHAAFDIDRTLWNVCYGSGRLFERLGMHLVQDLISLELFVIANRD